MLFLDEINLLPLDLQGKLLRVIQEHRIRKVGGTDEINLNFKLITACNIPPSELLHSDNFRTDLYYRLNVISISLPPLRERKEDIPLLANHFLNTFIGSNNISARGFDNDVYSFLQNCKWPGNVRELRNFVERSAYLCKSHTISMSLVKSLDDDFKYTSTIDMSPIQDIDNNTYSTYGVYDKHAGLKEIIAEVEKEIISQKLELNNGNISKTARQLDLPKQTLYNKIKKYKLL